MLRLRPAGVLSSTQTRVAVALTGWWIARVVRACACVQGVVDVHESFDARYSAAAQLQAWEDEVNLPLGEIGYDLQIRTLAEAQAAGAAPRARAGRELDKNGHAPFDDAVEQVSARGG